MEYIKNCVELQSMVLSLIKAEMKSYRLIKSLDSAGLLSDDYYADLDRVILNLLGFEKDEEREEVYKTYDKFLEQLIEMDQYDFSKKLNDLAMELYAELLAEKKLREKMNKLA